MYKKIMTVGESKEKANVFFEFEKVRTGANISLHRVLEIEAMSFDLSDKEVQGILAICHDSNIEHIIKIAALYGAYCASVELLEQATENARVFCE